MYELIIKRVIGEDEFIGTYKSYTEALNKTNELHYMLNDYYYKTDHFFISYIKD